jgi:hypothetical protein
MNKPTATELLARLRPNQQTGSKARCHFLMNGTFEEVSQRLTRLVSSGVVVSPTDSWMPLGFKKPEEAQMHKAERLIPSQGDRRVLSDWWLADARPKSTTPNWDIASTCLIDGQRGLLLVEAKAHHGELSDEGKRLSENSSKETMKGSVAL